MDQLASPVRPSFACRGSVSRKRERRESEQVRPQQREDRVWNSQTVAREQWEHGEASQEVRVAYPRADSGFHAFCGAEEESHGQQW